MNMKISLVFFLGRAHTKRDKQEYKNREKMRI